MEARGYKRIHGAATVAFVGLWGLAVPTGWINSVAFISHISMAALVYAAWSAWQSTRTEVKQDEGAA